MSASLVGSEMCIRDRSSAPPPRPACCPPAWLSGGHAAWPPRSGSPRWTCLLYTSDAADDM
eukprot:4936549-Alexandrium_andersonii.AAC.1